MPMLTIFSIWPRSSSVFIVSCEHILNFVLIFDFEKAKVSLFHIGKTKTFEDKIEHIMRCCSILNVNKNS